MLVFGSTGIHHSSTDSILGILWTQACASVEAAAGVLTGWPGLVGGLGLQVGHKSAHSLQVAYVRDGLSLCVLTMTKVLPTLSWGSSREARQS